MGVHACVHVSVRTSTCLPGVQARGASCGRLPTRWREGRPLLLQLGGAFGGGAACAAQLLSVSPQSRLKSPGGEVLATGQGQCEPGGVKNGSAGGWKAALPGVLPTPAPTLALGPVSHSQRVRGRPHWGAAAAPTRSVPPAPRQRAKFTLLIRTRLISDFPFLLLILGCWWLGPSPVIIASLGPVAQQPQFSYYGLRGTAPGPTTASGTFSWAGQELLPA